MHVVLLGRNIKVNPASELVLYLQHEICYFASPTETIIKNLHQFATTDKIYPLKWNISR